MKQALSIICFFTFFIAIESQAQTINWERPEVIPEALVRNNRRVLRFSGVSKPGTQVRVRENKVKMIYPGGTVRWARIPQKHAVQFPVIASETGFFSFDLYLPTTAVEIPLEVFKNGKWRSYKFSFDVPTAGTAREFQFNEESFKVREDEGPVEDFLSEYDRKIDQGQVVNDRDNRKSWVTKKFLAWGGVGFNYITLAQDTSNGAPAAGNLTDFGFPSWEIGAEYRPNVEWKFDAAYLSRNAKVDPDGSYTLQNNDFNWSEIRLNATYYLPSFEAYGGRLGLKVGLHRHDVPFLKTVGVNTYRIFSNTLTFAAAGANFEKISREGWIYDGSFMLLYPALTGSSFDLNSGYGLYAGFNMLKEIVPAFYMGGKVDVHWLTLDTSFDVVGARLDGDITLYHVSPSFILKTEF